MKSLFVWLLIAGTAALVVCPPATAEAVDADSIDRIVLDSAWVFKGKVVGADTVLGKDGRKYQIASVAVEKTLRGKHLDQAKFLLRPWLSMAAEAWRAEGKPMIFCVSQTARQKDKANLPDCDWIVNESGNSAWVVLLDGVTDGRLRTHRVFTRDFKVLSEPDAIVKYVAGALSEDPNETSPRFHRTTVPPNTPVFEKLWAEGRVTLAVPVDKRLEEYGRRLCQLPPGLERAEGAEILRHFKNDENIKILKSLLADDSTSVRIVARGGTDKKVASTRTKVYEVRRAAYDALRELGVDVKRPILEVPLEDDKPAKRQEGEKVSGPNATNFSVSPGAD